MPHYIVTLDLGYKYYTFLCREHDDKKAIDIINKHCDGFNFYGDPQITTTSDDEFSLFSNSMTVIL